MNLTLWTEKAMETIQLYFNLESNCLSPSQSQVDKSLWHLESTNSKYATIKTVLPTSLTLHILYTIKTHIYILLDSQMKKNILFGYCLQLEYLTETLNGVLHPEDVYSVVGIKFGNHYIMILTSL